MQFNRVGGLNRSTSNTLGRIPPLQFNKAGTKILIRTTIWYTTTVIYQGMCTNVETFRHLPILHALKRIPPL